MRTKTIIGIIFFIFIHYFIMKNFCIVTDWLDLYGGAERVVKKITEIYPIHRVYALTDQRDSQSKHLFFEGSPEVKTTLLEVLGSKFRIALPLFPFFIKSLKIDKEVDVLLSSSFNVAKGIEKSRKNQVHICYIQTRNFKYIEDAESLENYFGKLKYFLLPFVSPLKKWDKKSAQNPDLIIANSKYTQELLIEKYNRTSVVVYPPVDTDKFILHEQKEDYYIAIGRFSPMKRFDLLIDAFNEMPDKKLILVGDGFLMDKFRRKAKENIHFTGFITSEEVRDLLQKAKACICVGIEDFGIAAVESQACGTPVIAYAVGGTGETIIDKKTGVLFNHQTKEDIKKGIDDLEQIKFDFKEIHENAKVFSADNFKTRFKEVVDNYIQSFEDNLK